MGSRTPPKPYALMCLATDRRRRNRDFNKVDVDVPGRVDGRDHDHTEIYSIVGMLKVVFGKKLNHPTMVIHRDRPDFLLAAVDGSIGVEVTEAVSENTVRMDVLRESEPDLSGVLNDENLVYFARKASVDEDKIYPCDLRDMIRANCAGDGWVGDGAEGWATAIAHFAQIKSETALKSGFERFDQNWLLIYDNWNEPLRSRGRGDQALHKRFLKLKMFQTFDRILVIDGRELGSWAESGVVRHRRPRQR